MKTCVKCRQQKAIGEFYRHKAMADGHLNACKDCVKAAVRANRLDKVDKYRQYDVARAGAPHRVKLRQDYIKTPEGKAARLRCQKRRRALEPLKDRARYEVAYALQRGRLTKWPCIVCGAEKVEAHHPDYSRPLDVQWLCRPHHREVHQLVEAT